MPRQFVRSHASSSPVHFSISHSLLSFSTFVSVFLFLYYSLLQIKKPSLSHFHLLSVKHDHTTHTLLALAIPSKDSFMPNTSINSSLFLRSNSFTPHIARITAFSLLFGCYGDLGAESPALENFVYFLAKIT